MDCRAGCGACCIGLSISSPIPGMPDGKPAGVRCIQLSVDNLCLLFGKPERPEVCTRLTPMEEMCGETAEEALVYLAFLERATAPSHPTVSTRNGISSAGETPPFSPIPSIRSR